jgi:serine/threonine protein phosphatase PrpC
MPRFATAAASSRGATEDRATVVPIDVGWLVCVADGVGGIAGGAKAADLFVAGVQRTACRAGFDLTSPAAWIALLQDLDHEIAVDPMAGETTGIALAVTSGLIVGASCGDSRALLSTSTGWQDLTSQQRRKPRLGTGQACALPFTAEAHGTLVVGTDGLFDYIKLDDISRTVLHASESEDAADGLIRLVLDRYRTPPDDIAIVVGCLDSPA